MTLGQPESVTSSGLEFRVVDSMVSLTQAGGQNRQLNHDEAKYHIPFVDKITTPQLVEIWGHEEIAQYGLNDMRSHQHQKALKMFLPDLFTNDQIDLADGQPIKLNYLVYPKTMPSGQVKMLGIFNHLEIKSLADLKVAPIKSE